MPQGKNVCSLKIGTWCHFSVPTPIEKTTVLKESNLAKTKTLKLSFCVNKCFLQKNTGWPLGGNEGSFIPIIKTMYNLIPSFQILS